MQSSTRATPARPVSPPVANPGPRSIDFTLNFPARIASAVQARARARGIALEAWIREWAAIGLAEESIGAVNPLAATTEESANSARPRMPEPKDWNTVTEVAEYLAGVAPKTIYRLIAVRKIGYVRIGTGRGGLHIRRSDVEAYLAANTQGVHHG